ncbi:MBL fold metallo-hydrolase [Elizabethkingia meningoseptica]|uniref:MBL fold metallo-hydrolase n=1 Tax=Elizabethkingia meningoseptica TaxID=238 RepID=UPI0022F1C5B7|nr:MBL fold metallo-hydrolase [Elizabethkingia meningoseptica]EJK5328199.1 MBL fold metallo-hydrolase [Elizabethkingia meningoseptica]MDE5466601.1 MBL fold metallo-hydrolase [Elizabethkingia meningoseptica]MDE5474169.1 MBL fold metallo-hydrolase [Elizabethkingia meningoseptica]MDE5477602.1 MBL fold metallo-hydrolase [Elizabethkingia meningoseptica]MDE5483920.1 MBL fold metallo-hydrolase [Elizabethkingia meningoseptica]
MLRQIAPEVFQISLMPRNSINSYIIEGVLVDSGIRSSYNTVKKTLQKIPVYQHVLTHAHPDHQGCSDQICAEFDIPLLCHSDEVFRTETGMVTNDYPTSQHWVAKLQQKYWAGQGHKVDRTIVENDRIGNFQVIETPGHSAGHISLFRERDGVLILGDAATNMNLLTTAVGLRLPPNMFTSDQQCNIKSLQKLAELNPAIICFGHGPIMQNKDRKFEQFVAKCSATV